MGNLARTAFVFTALLWTTACVSPIDDSDATIDTPRGLPGGASGGPFDTCLAELEGKEVGRVATSVERQFRLSREDATDIARDAMLKVCSRHAVAPYDRLAAALQQAATNKARRGWSRQKRHGECPLDERVPVCDLSQPRDVWFDAELSAATAALCAETSLNDAIIRERVIDEDDFAEIGRRHGIGPDQARTRYHNAMNRVKARVVQGLCIPAQRARPRLPVGR